MRQLGKGDEIAGYVIEALAGQGGMGLVYRARQRRPDRVVAIKVIAPEHAIDPSFRARFERESTTAAQIEHPNVIPVYEVGEDEGLLFISMRFVDGVDLRGLLTESGRLAPERAARLVAQVASALDAAHARGLVHRDVKPANILISGGDHVYLTDFGLTKRVADTSGMTKTGMIVGTVDYIAPEQIESGHVDARADVYALGCVTFELLSGQVPFPRVSDIAKIFAHVHEPVPPLLDVPAPLAAAVARAMAKRPADRFLSAGDFARAALAAVAGRPGPGDERSVATGAAAIADVAPPAAVVGAPTSAPAAAGAAVPATTPAGAPAASPASSGSGAAPPSGRRRSPWLLGGGIAALVAVSAVGVVLALGAGGASSTPGSSSPALSLSSTRPVRARRIGNTLPEVYHPAIRSGAVAAPVTRRARGFCSTPSLVAQRPDAWRCSVGAEIHDPCFTVSATRVLCPTKGPLADAGLLVTLSAPLPATANHYAGSRGEPWAIELADGRVCLPITLMARVIAGERQRYECTRNIGLYGPLQRSGPVWTIDAAGKRRSRLFVARVANAWF